MKKYLKYVKKNYNKLKIKSKKSLLKIKNKKSPLSIKDQKSIKDEKRRKFFLSISKKTILLEFLLILVVCIGLSYISLKNGSEIIINHTENTLKLLAKNGANSIRNMIFDNVYQLEDIAKDIDINTIDQEHVVDRILRETSRHGFLDVAIVNPDRTGFYLRSKEAIETGNIQCIDKAFIGYPSMSPLSNGENNSYLLYAAPIYNEEDEIIAVFVGKKSIFSLNELTDDMGLGDNGFAYIFDTNGYICAHPFREYVINRVNILKNADTNERFESWAGAIRQLGIGNEGVINYDFSGNKYYAGIVPIPDTDWILGVCAEQKDVFGQLGTLKYSIITSSIIFVIAGIVVAVILSRSTAVPIRKLSNEIKRFSDYDFTLNEKSPILKYQNRKDEIGIITKSILNMHKNFIKLIENITKSSKRVGDASSNLMVISQQVSDSAEDIAKAVDEIANGASEQASSTEEGTLLIEELGNSITDNDRQMGNVMELALEIDNLKEEGLDIVKDLVDKTHKANESIDEIERVIANMSSKTEKVVNISNMIKDIAEQTNLLALNAAIEAARAGESGRGFAVVADEIRKLSDQSNRFAEEIAKIIKDLIDEVKMTMDTMEKVNNSLSLQTESVNMTNSKFDGIAKSIENIKELISAINASSKEMKEKKDKVISVMHNLASISEENAASTEEVSASIEEQTASMEEVANLSEKLANLASEMEKSISIFKCDKS